MHKLASPPSIFSDKHYHSLQIGPGFFRGSSPVIDWNVVYNDKKPLELPPNTTEELRIINYYEQPFNYIEVDTTFGNPSILVIQNIPPCWLSIYNCGLIDITISPQINGKDSYDNTNEYIIPAGEYRMVSIVPGIPPLSDSLQNPTTFQFT